MDYCRLCAAQNLVENLIDFELQTTNDSLLMEKFTRVGVDLTAEYLPMTFCQDCYVQLDLSYQFLEKVKNAQASLRHMLSKKDVDTDKGDSIKEEPEDLEESYASPAMFDFDDVASVNDLKEGTISPKIKKRKRSMFNERTKLDYNNDQNSWKDYVWMCTKCENNFTDLSLLRKHSINIHKTCCTLKCVDCSEKPFVNYITFTKHVAKHRKYLCKICFICNTLFPTLHKLRQHIRGYKDNHICRVCAEVFDNSQSLEHHINNYAKSIHYSKRLKPKIYQCEECKKIFKQSSQLYVHQVVHNTSRSRNYSCHLCPKTFYRKGELNAHLEIHENLPQFQCEICKRYFRRKVYLKHHILKHNNKRISCEYCGKSITTSYIKEHIKIFHMEEMKYACSVCGKKFRLKATLKVHERQHTGEKPFSCSRCCHFFTNHSNFSKHMKRRHNIDVAKRRLKLSEEKIVTQ